MNPGPWNVASRGYPGLVGIRFLESLVVFKSTQNHRSLTVVTALSHGLCACVNVISLPKKDAVLSEPRLQSSLASPFLLLVGSLASVRRGPFAKVLG